MGVRRKGDDDEGIDVEPVYTLIPIMNKFVVTCLLYNKIK